ncbi:MAG TPA: hypothetical protein VFX59_11900 [Polyangiales bacterium]|nr:hypothetical protein [Polyangiales bacterium]
MSLLGIERDGASPSPDSFGSSGSTYTGRAQQTTISGRVPAPRWASPWWLLFLGLAIAEVVALGVREHRVPVESDWSAAAEHVRAQLGPKDAVTVAPGWADPLLRLYLGDRLTLRISARSDLDAFERLWVLSIRGARAPDAPARQPDYEETVGRVRIERYDLGRSTVLLDFADALSTAHVEMIQEGASVSCPLRTFPPSVLQGGLGGGVVAPRQRFQCDFDRPWLWVGTTVIEALDLAPHRCIWNHPQGKEPMAITYRQIPLGPRIVLHGGLDYHDERDANKAPVKLRVFLDGKEVADLMHRDGDGMKRWEIDLRKTLGTAIPVKGDLRFEVTTPEAFRRSFCWTGSVQSALREDPKVKP